MTAPSGPQGPMHGLRVVELCEEIGEFAGKLLADMGADVVKVEPPGGSQTRSFAPFLNDEPHPDRSLFFWHYNTSKRSVALDLDGEDGREAFRRLVASADVLVEDRAPGWMDERGLDYEDLRGDNPDLIHCAITPFGRSGPRADDPATDLTILAGGGPMWSCGYDDHSIPPVRGGGNQGYQTGCHWALITVLTALLYRDGGGGGQFIDVSLHAASNVTTEAGSYQWLVAQETVQRQTGRHAGVTESGPTQVQAQDGVWMNTGLFPRRPHEFRTLIEWMQELGLYDEYEQSPLLEVGAGMDRMLDMARAAEDDEEAALLTAGREAMIFLVERMDAYDYFYGAQERGFQVGIIYAPEDVIEDPHFIARGFRTEVEHPELGRSFVYPGAPYAFQGSPWAITRRPPLPGEHTAEVLAELDHA
ncbi:MAG: CoA transferase [Chloroflexota bacterium]|nr:CoA transferase [Chloroflexota bacterium]